MSVKCIRIPWRCHQILLPNKHQLLFSLDGVSQAGREAEGDLELLILWLYLPRAGFRGYSAVPSFPFLVLCKFLVSVPLQMAPLRCAASLIHRTI